MTTSVAVTGADTTLFHVAALTMGDALGAIRIAQATGMADPWLDGQQTVQVPSPGPNNGGLPAPGTTP